MYHVIVESGSRPRIVSSHKNYKSASSAGRVVASSGVKVCVCQTGSPTHEMALCGTVIATDEEPSIQTQACRLHNQ